MKAVLRELQSLMGPVGPHEAEDLLAHVLGVRRAELFTGAGSPDPEQWERARALAARRAAGEPLQDLIGWVPFLDARVRVGPGVLVPRPETELLTSTALELWAELGIPEPRHALDVGTGSGCIAAAVALADPRARVTATDISGEALAWAARTVYENGLAGRVRLLKGDLFEPLQAAGCRDGFASLVISNPPYVADGEREALPVEVRGHEPAGALFSGPEGLDHISRIIAGIPRWLAAPGLLAVEIGWKQEAAALSLARSRGVFARAEVRPDLAGRPRMLFGWR
ncbi:MAG: peptide chain release factor N(5)-glutamine methyltransferase [Candidatus Eisenbacteria bacterium]|nr:peptide chain release factor N(5)-glutamine methyltransferase [Candidatus Eisenbacteria bacterium]